jgi:hypothetical protein
VLPVPQVVVGIKQRLQGRHQVPKCARVAARKDAVGCKDQPGVAATCPECLRHERPETADILCHDGSLFLLCEREDNLVWLAS